MTTHLHRGLASLACGVLLTAVPCLGQQGDADLAKGASQVAAGDYQGAIGTLSGVVRRLQAAPGREKDAAAAYLQLGLAYAGLDQASPAVSQFYQAIKRDPAIRPDPTAPARAQELFGEALAQSQVEAAKPVARGSGKGKVLAILGGTAAVAGVGLAVLAKDSDGLGPGSAPVISNLVVRPILVLGGGVGTIPIEFDYTDADGDISSVAVRAPDSPAVNPLPEAVGKKSGHALVNQSTFLPPAGFPVIVTVSVNDQSGHMSNALTATTSRP
jgi:hypothetical protein